MAIHKTDIRQDRDYIAPQAKINPGKPGTLQVRLSSGRTMELTRPRIIRTQRLDSMTLSRDVVRALGRLEARTRNTAGPKAHQLRLKV